MDQILQRTHKKVKGKRLNKVKGSNLLSDQKKNATKPSLRQAQNIIENSDLTPSDQGTLIKLCINNKEYIEIICRSSKKGLSAILKALIHTG